MSSPPFDPQRAHRQGRWLVVLQFGLLGLLGLLLARALFGEVRAATAFLALAALLAMAGTTLGLAALAANRPGNFNVHPSPRPGGRLVADGIYRRLRHPMYVAVLLLAAAAAVATASAAALLAWIALWAVLRVKSGLEERWLLQHHAGYADYRRRTRRGF